jgi:serine acetyltransferase
MSKATLFDASYEKHKQDLLGQLVERLEPIYSPEEVEALRIDGIDPQILSQRSGRGFVNRDLLETVLGNLLECVAPGSHNALEPGHQQPRLIGAMSEIADQVYAMIAQSLLAAGEDEGVEEQAQLTTFALLWELPLLKERARWNRFAALRDPAVWDAYLLYNCELTQEQLTRLDFGKELEEAIRQRAFDHYRHFLKELRCAFIFDYQMQLVMSTYPGWRVLFYHDVAHALTLAGRVQEGPGLERRPVPLLPRAIAELGGRYYQTDLHPETRIGDANFIDHPHRGLTTGQTGVIGSGCHLYPCTLGGLSDKVQQRHPVIGDYVFIGTDAGLFGPVRVGNGSAIGANAEIHGLVEIGPDCRIGASVFIGTIRAGEQRPGKVRLGKGVRVGSGTIIENVSPLDLVIPERAEIPARSHLTNDGCGGPKFVRE